MVMVVEVTVEGVRIEGVRMEGATLRCGGGAVGVSDVGGGTFVVSVAMLIERKTGDVARAHDEGGGNAGDD